MSPDKMRRLPNLNLPDGDGPASEFDNFMRGAATAPPPVDDYGGPEGQTFATLDAALRTPGLEAFWLWAVDQAREAPFPEALRRVLGAVVFSLAPLVGGRSEAERLVDAYVAKVMEDADTLNYRPRFNDLMGFVTGLCMGMRIGQLNAGSALLYGKPSIIVDGPTVDGNGGMQFREGSFDANWAGKAEGMAAARVLKAGSAEHKSSQAFNRLIERMTQAARQADNAKEAATR